MRDALFTLIWIALSICAGWKLSEEEYVLAAVCFSVALIAKLV